VSRIRPEQGKARLKMELGKKSQNAAAPALVTLLCNWEAGRTELKAVWENKTILWLPPAYFNPLNRPLNRVLFLHC
jgi:hypothetical protein